MTVSIHPILTALEPPAWAVELSSAKLVTMRIPGAVDMNCQAFERTVSETYDAIRSRLKNHHPVRFWNHIPGIHQMMDARRDRYMVFNAARYRVLNDWLGRGKNLPAASGVGHDGEQLVIHCLAMEKPGRAIENPRQTPAFKYSTRYGPLPPCFSRATIITDPADERSMLLVSGTASIRGESSMYCGDLNRQLDETIENLRSLMAARDPSAGLDAFTDLRVYYVQQSDRQVIQDRVRGAFGASVRIQMSHAQLCRKELLVEIEGVANL